MMPLIVVSTILRNDMAYFFAPTALSETFQMSFVKNFSTRFASGFFPLFFDLSITVYFKNKLTFKNIETPTVNTPTITVGTDGNLTDSNPNSAPKTNCIKQSVPNVPAAEYPMYAKKPAAAIVFRRKNANGASPKIKPAAIIKSRYAETAYGEAAEKSPTREKKYATPKETELIIRAAQIKNMAHISVRLYNVIL